MPKVHHVKKARKDNRVAKKGESYYGWKFAYSGKRYSLTYPKASQLTQSDKLSRLSAAQETVEETHGGIDDYSWDHAYVDNLLDVLREAASEVREVGDEYMESGEAIREHFAESPTADECDEKAYRCEDMAGAIEDAIDEIEELEHLKRVLKLKREIQEIEADKQKLPDRMTDLEFRIIV